MDKAIICMYCLAIMGFLLFIILGYGIRSNYIVNKQSYQDQLAYYLFILDFFQKFNFSKEYTDQILELENDLLKDFFKEGLPKAKNEFE